MRGKGYLLYTLKIGTDQGQGVRIYSYLLWNRGWENEQGGWSGHKGGRGRSACGFCPEKYPYYKGARARKGIEY